jgi:alpha-1,2-mannosyltransferase
MFLASTAFLPSTTSLYLTLLAFGAWFRHQYRLAIFATALSTLLSKLGFYFVKLAGVKVQERPV